MRHNNIIIMQNTPKNIKQLKVIYIHINPLRSMWAYLGYTPSHHSKEKNYKKYNYFNLYK